jgi:hypothetical protein
MGGRKWHLIAAGAAASAVAGVVLANDTTPTATLNAHPFASVDYLPDNGGMVVASPTIDVTTVIETPPPAPPAKPTSSATTSTAPSSKPRERPPNFTITFSIPELPSYFPDCAVARAVGAAPIRRGQPGYREELDGDHDGTACEKR